MASDLKPLVSAKDAAIYLWGEWNDTTRKRIYRWIDDKQIRTIQDGRRYWIPRAELSRFDDVNRSNPGDDQGFSGGEPVFQIGNS